MLGGGLTQVGEGLAESGGEAGAHFEERVGSSDEHAADGDGTHNVAPDSVRHVGPIFHAVGWHVCPELRSEKKNEQRHHESPGDHAAGELDRGQSNADDVADAEIGGADAGRGKNRSSTGGHNVGAARSAEPNLAVAEASDADVQVGIGGEQAESSEDVNQSANADVPEKIFCGLGAALPGLVNFRGGQRFGEGQLGVFHHAAANQGDEEDAENAADHDQCGGFPVGIGDAKGRPSLGQQERG